ncbi:MAG TPA: hypothetical protein VFA15_06355, partial [Nitrososphaera sp.]|nr:hypothetical protein [Nitrososphaera sp.]
MGTLLAVSFQAMGRQFLEYIECVLDSEHNEKAVAFPLELEERYLDVKVLARGGMGQIFCAVDRILDKKVAIKVLPASTDEAALVRFQ